MPSLRALIVDDERLARKDLRMMLAAEPDITVVGEAGGAAQAVELARRLEPDVVFLDIQMPGSSGFEVVSGLDSRIRVVFVTAFDAYAIRAFEVNALDYLLKPVHPARLGRTLARLRAPVPEPSASPEPALTPLTYEDRLFLTLGNRSVFLNVSDIVAIGAAGDYSELTLADGRTGLVLKSLKAWDARLPEAHFTRIHRSTIINFAYVERLEPWFNYAHRVYLRGLDAPLTMSRRYAARLKERLG